MRRTLALLMALFLTLGAAAPGMVWAEAVPAAEETTAALQEKAAEETTEAAEETAAAASTEATGETTATEETSAPETGETPSPEKPAEPEEPKYLWDAIRELFGFSQEPGPLEQLQMFNEKGDELYPNPSFDPGCYRYEAKVPIQGFRIEVLAYPGVAVYIGDDLLEDGNMTVIPEWSEEKEATVTIRLVAEGWEGEDYVLHLTQLPPEPTELEITREPEKTEYLAGEEFDPTGIKVLIHYSDGSTREAGEEELSFQPLGALTEKDTFVTIFCGDLAQKLEIKVRGVLPGEGTQASPYLLATEADLRELDTWVTEGDSRADKSFFRMENDIVLTGEWDGIGDENTPFTGDFDGNNCQITIPAGGKALFARTRDAAIHDLRLYGPEIEDYGLVSYYVVDYTTKSYATFSRVTIVSGTKTLYSGFIGGYASGQDQVLIEDCTIEENVVIGYDKSQSHIGSFAGEFNGTVKNSRSAAKVYGVDWVGGLIGNTGQSMGNFTVEGSSFSGAVSASGKYVGGIVGGGYAGTRLRLETAPNAMGVVIENCTCTGSVSGDNGVGGIFGAEACVQQFWDNGVGRIRNNRFTGFVRGTGSYVGGVIGFMQSLNADMRISGNYYENAEKGIGAVAHVDTSGVPNGFRDGTYYYDTSKFVSDGRGGVKSYTDSINCVELQQYMALRTIGTADEGQNRAVSKPNLNRKDDPLGKDLDQLCYTEQEPEARITDLELKGSCREEYVQGEALDLTGLTFWAIWSNGDETEVSVEDITVSGYDPDQLGEQTIRCSYGNQEVRFTVTVSPPPAEATVSVSILGDVHHENPYADGGPHGLERGGLITWAVERNVEANATDTVWDVIQKVAQRHGLSMDADDDNKYGSIYIRGIDGLSEFDNGPNSGWMYTVNGTHPEVGVSARFIQDGDVIILHYTDDYSYEEGGNNYGMPVELRATPEDVDAYIDQIGVVTGTEECLERIELARQAYDLLSDEEKQRVTLYDVLLEAEAEYQRLKNADDKEKAAYVEELILQIGVVTPDSGKLIRAAREAYNALPLALRRLIQNYTVLAEAEVSYAKQTATEEDWKSARAVMAIIEKLATAGQNSEEDVQAARMAYERLTDLQKLLVDNLEMLETAETEITVQRAMGKVSDAYIATGDYMEKLGTPGVGPIGGEWMVIGLARSGRKVPNAEDYYQTALEYIRGAIDTETGRLHRAKSTDNSRMILALTALGKDAESIDGFNLIQGLSDLDYVKYQGNNGPIWALLALDSGNYPAPAGGTTTRQSLLREILRAQTSDGGWAITGDKADSDMTGMALTALAPYYEKDDRVQAAVDKAIARLSQMQDADGGFSTSYGDGNMVATSESISQVVTALSALGIDPDTDARFVKDGGSAIDALLRYFVTGGGFKHIQSGEIDGMATEQAYYALTAYYRFLTRQTSLYDMTDIIDLGGDPEETADTTAASAVSEFAEPGTTESTPAGTGVSWTIFGVSVLLAYGLGGATAAIVLPRLRKKSKTGEKR